MEQIKGLFEFVWDNAEIIFILSAAVWYMDLITQDLAHAIRKRNEKAEVRK